MQEYITNKDIMLLVPCGKNKATKIRKKAILKYNGFNPNFPRLVRKSSVLKVLEESLWVSLHLDNGVYMNF
jgi:hypothetical protein